MVNSVRTGGSKGMRRLNVRPTIALIAGDKEPAKALPINCGNVYHLEICYVGQATVVVALGAGVFTRAVSLNSVLSLQLFLLSQVHYSKTLTEHDIKHIERHLSMKRTIRKKIMRDLQQAFVQVVLLVLAYLNFFTNRYSQDPAELSKNSVGRSKREINLQVRNILFDI